MHAAAKAQRAQARRPSSNDRGIGNAPETRLTSDLQNYLRERAGETEDVAVFLFLLHSEPPDAVMGPGRTGLRSLAKVMLVSQRVAKIRGGIGTALAPS